MKTRECVGYLFLILIVGVGSLAAGSGAWSQQKQSVSVSIPAGAATYTQEVGGCTRTPSKRVRAPCRFPEHQLVLRWR
jgi:hypothetical protein